MLYRCGVTTTWMLSMSWSRCFYCRTGLIVGTGPVVAPQSILDDVDFVANGYCNRSYCIKQYSTGVEIEYKTHLIIRAKSKTYDLSLRFSSCLPRPFIALDVKLHQ